MADVTLVLKGNNGDLVNKVKEAQAATQKLYDTAQTGMKQEQGIIQKLEAEYNTFLRLKKEAYKTEDIIKYNQKLAETKNKLAEMDQVGLKAEKQTESLTATIGKWALGLGIVTTAVGLLKNAFQQTQQGMILFNQVGAVTQQVLSNIVNGVGDWNHGVAEAWVLAKQMAELKIQEKRDSIETNTLLRDYNRLYSQGIDATISAEEKIRLLTEAKNKYIQATKNEIQDTRDELRIVVDQWKNDPTNIKLEGQAIDLKNKILSLQGELEEGTRRLTRQITSEQQQAIKAQQDALTKIHDLGKKLTDAFITDEENTQKEANDKRLKQEEDYQRAANAIIDKYNSLNIDALTGVDKLKLQRELAFGEIDALKNHLLAFGPLTDNQQDMILKMVDDVQKVFIKGMEKEAKVTPEQKSAISKALLSGMTDLAGLQKTNTFIPSKPKESSLWNLLGIQDPESDEGKKQVEAINKVADSTMKALTSILDRQVQDAQRKRELLDQQISETESEVQTETELYKAGYASNVDAKKKELADLKAQRDAALKKEEEAVKKQRALDTITQVSSLITASAKTFEAFPGPLLPVAIAVVAAMFAAFAATKVKASQAGFYKGGWTGPGDRFEEAGTVHKEEYVVRKGPAYKFRSVLEAINQDDKRLAFNRFTKISPELLRGTTINNVTVENEGPNKRLDQVNANLKALKQNREEIIELADQTIIHKGTSTRTIRR